MGIWKDKKRGDWCWKFQYQGREYGGRGHKTKGEARTAREERRKEVKSGTPETPADTDFRTAANFYLDYAKRRFAEKTYKYKAFVFRSFQSYTGNLPLSKIGPATLHKYLNTRPSNNNYNAHRKDLCALFTYIRQVLKIPIPHPCWDLERMPHSPAKASPPSEQQILQLVMAADPDEQDFILTIVHTLARVDEILRLQWQDVNFEQRGITLWTRKKRGGEWKPQNKPMNEDLYQILLRRYKKRSSEKWVFPNPKTGTRYQRRPKLMRSLCTRAFAPGKKVKDYKGPVFGFHSLRKAIATLLQDREKVGTKTVSGLLGHDSVRTTEIYLSTVPADQAEAVKRLEGRFWVADPVAELDKTRHPKRHQKDKAVPKSLRKLR